MNNVYIERAIAITRSMTKSVIFGVGAVLAATILIGQTSQAAKTQGLPYFDKQEFTPYWPQEMKAIDFKAAEVSDFSGTDQDGKAITVERMKNGISLVNFFFAECPGLCPTMMQSVRSFQKKLGPAASHIHVYSFSVKPDRDTPSVLLDYANNQRIDLKTWTLITGKRDEMYRVGRDMFHADGSVGAQKAKSEFIHTRNIYLVDASLKIRGVYDTGDVPAMNNLKADVEALLAQSKTKKEIPLAGQ